MTTLPLEKIFARFPKWYEIVEDLYCKNNGRPSTDPVVLFKKAIIQHLYGISSLRRTADEVNLNVAYRWFLKNLGKLDDNEFKEMKKHAPATYYILNQKKKFPILSNGRPIIMKN